MRPPRIVHFNGAEHCLHIPPDRAAPRIRNRGCGTFSWPAKRDGDSDPDKRAMRRDGIYTCTKNASSEEMIVRKSQTVEDTETDNIKKKKEEDSSLLLFLSACMHSVCALYASPTAYIYSPSALRTRLFAFLYALYAVNSGVVFLHSMHSRFFDAYNAYNLSIAHPGNEADGTDGLRTRP